MKLSADWREPKNKHSNFFYPTGPCLQTPRMNGLGKTANTFPILIPEMASLGTIPGQKMSHLQWQTWKGLVEAWLL